MSIIAYIAVILVMIIGIAVVIFCNDINGLFLVIGGVALLILICRVDMQINRIEQSIEQPIETEQAINLWVNN